jgi:hypothetical protein
MRRVAVLLRMVVRPGGTAFQLHNVRSLTIWPIVYADSELPWLAPVEEPAPAYGKGLNDRDRRGRWLVCGVGLSHITKQLLEECFAPDGHPHLACDGSFVGVSPQHVERHAADHREIAGRMILSRAGIILVEDHIEVPMQVVVSRPEGFHLQPLSEPDVNLSAHPAPIIQLTTRMS